MSNIEWRISNDELFGLNNSRTPETQWTEPEDGWQPVEQRSEEEEGGDKETGRQRDKGTKETREARAGSGKTEVPGKA